MLVSNFLLSCLISPHMIADWWESYGAFTPDLQRLTIKILSLTCSSSEDDDLTWGVISEAMGAEDPIVINFRK